MSLLISRRSLVLGAIISSLALKAQSASKPVYVYIDESGTVDNPSYSGPFVTGILSTSDAEGLVKRLIEARLPSNFKCQLSYNSTNRYKEDFAKRAIDIFVADKSAKLDLFALSKKANKYWPKDKDNLEALYSQHQSRVTYERFKANNKIIILIERRSLGQRDERLKNELNYQFGATAEVRFIKSKSNNILQLCDLITGSILSAVRENPPEPHPLKIRISEYLAMQLGMKNLSEMSKDFSMGNIQLRMIER